MKVLQFLALDLTSIIMYLIQAKVYNNGHYRKQASDITGPGTTGPAKARTRHA